MSHIKYEGTFFNDKFHGISKFFCLRLIVLFISVMKWFTQTVPVVTDRKVNLEMVHYFLVREQNMSQGKQPEFNDIDF